MLFNGTPLKHTTEATVQCPNHPHLTFLIQATYYKVTSVSTTWSSYSTLIYLPKEKEAYVQSSFTCNNPKRKTTQMSTKGWTHKQIMVQPYSEILLSGLKKNNYTHPPLPLSGGSHWHHTGGLSEHGPVLSWASVVGMSHPEGGHCPGTTLLQTEHLIHTAPSNSRNTGWFSVPIFISWYLQRAFNPGVNHP